MNICLNRTNKMKKCPVCRSTRIVQSEGKMRCKKCNFSNIRMEELLEENFEFAQDRKQIKEKRYKQGGSLRIQKK